MAANNEKEGAQEGEKQGQQPEPKAKAEASASVPQQKQQEQPSAFRGIAAEIVEVSNKGKTGMYGEIYTVMCNILEGRDKGRVIKRNILGPVKVGDIVRLVDTSREAKQISVR